MSRDIPIIFSAPMVRALLEGRKTMTRRLAWRDHVGLDIEPEAANALRRKGWKVSGPDDTDHRIGWAPSPWQKVNVRDRLWVRESITQSGALVSYMAGGPSSHRTWPHEWSSPSRPSIHMHRWASRLTLVVTATKIERLQDISDDDAIAEGIEYNPNLDPVGPCKWRRYGVENTGVFPPSASFRSLWGSLHGPDSWENNPEVVATSFRVIKTNIDAPEARAA